MRKTWIQHHGGDCQKTSACEKRGKVQKNCLESVCKNINCVSADGLSIKSNQLFVNEAMAMMGGLQKAANPPIQNQFDRLLVGSTKVLEKRKTNHEKTMPGKDTYLLGSARHCQSIFRKTWSWSCVYYFILFLIWFLVFVADITTTVLL